MSIQDWHVQTGKGGQFEPTYSGMWKVEWSFWDHIPIYSPNIFYRFVNNSNSASLM